MEAVQQMLGVCEDWISSDQPENMIRAARHYERASQIVISQQVRETIEGILQNK